MPPIIKVSDENNLVDTSNYKYAKFSFDKFNPVQSQVFNFYDKDVNAVIGSKTGSGKTLTAEMILSYEIRKNKVKGLYLVPLRSLAQEKIDDWTDKNHHFGDLKISVCSGDYRLTPERVKELDESDLIIMTYEMLACRVRNHKSENNDWLIKLKVLVCDEIHTVSTERGHHIEAGLMKFTDINPDARLIFLSATMPNIDEIGEWVSYSLTKKETYVLKSNYRPCPLIVHYESYYDKNYKYDDKETEKVNSALDIIQQYPQDKFLVFAHTKRTGELMKGALRSCGIMAEFHNAGLEKKERVSLENRFRTDPKLRVVVATSTLAAGLNMPARRVIILGIHRGLTEVDNMDIEQEIGRSGRPKYDKQGDAYILLPETKMDFYISKLKNPQRIESQLLSKSGDHHKVLAFHIVSEIHHGDIKTSDDVHRWYNRSLASFQSFGLSDEVVDKTIQLLKNRGVITEEDGVYKTTSVGIISSMFYFSPFDVADLKQNFTELFDKNKQDDDYWLSMALGNIDSQYTNIISKAEKDEISMYSARIKELFGSKYTNEAIIKIGYCYFQLLNGNNSSFVAPIQRNLQFDYNRLSQVLQTLDTMCMKNGRQTWFQRLEERIRSGIPMYLVELCMIPNIGKVRGKKLYDSGVKTIEDFVELNVAKLKKLLNIKEDMAQEMLTNAQKLVMV